MKCVLLSENTSMRFADVLTAAFEETAKDLEEKKVEAQLASESIDVTLPGRPVATGHRHVLTQTSEEIEDIFIGMGFQIVDGFEVEKDYYNFERMNLPKTIQPVICRTLSISQKKFFVRTHTVQFRRVRWMPMIFLKVLWRWSHLGRVFRRDTDDATHSHHLFHQIEGLVVGKNISMADLQGTLQLIVQNVWWRASNSFTSILLPIYWAICWGWMFHASSVEEPAVTYVRKLVGSRLWVPVWFTHVSWDEWYRCDCLLWICLWSWTRA